MTVEIPEDTYRIFQESVASGRFATVEEALKESAHLLADSAERDEDWFAYADERIAAGLADVAAGRTIPAEDVLAELRTRNPE